MTKTPTCDACRFWARGQQLGQGTCVCLPPQLVHLGSGKIQVMHPPTPSNFSCGQWVAASPTNPEPESKPTLIE
jgi:hypothetical protein